MAQNWRMAVKAQRTMWEGLRPLLGTRFCHLFCPPPPGIGILAPLGGFHRDILLKGAYPHCTKHWGAVRRGKSPCGKVRFSFFGVGKFFHVSYYFLLHRGGLFCCWVSTTLRSPRRCVTRRKWGEVGGFHDPVSHCFITYLGHHAYFRFEFASPPL